MKTGILVIVILLLSVLCGCASQQVEAQPPLSVPATSTDTSPLASATQTSKVTAKVAEPKPVAGVNAARDLAWEEAHQDAPWINPGTIEINKFRPGGIVEYPVYYHNGSNNIFTEQKIVTTETSDPVVTITLLYKVLDGDYGNISGITSDLNTDELKLSKYESESNQVTIEGLADNSHRIITITYTGYKEYQIYYRPPDRVSDGFALPDKEVKNWVTLSESLLLMEPYETREVIVRLAMPEDAEVSSQKWAYYIGVSEATKVTTENVSTCKVTMR